MKENGKPIEGKRLEFGLESGHVTVVPLHELVTRAPDTDINTNAETTTPILESLEPEKPTSPLISRRKLLIGAGLAATGFGLGYLTKFRLPLPNLEDLIPSPEKRPKEGTLIFGNEIELPLRQFGISWAPDGKTPYYVNSDGNRVYIVAGNAKCYEIEGLKDQDLSEIENPKATIAFSPDPNATYNNPQRGEVAYRNGYSAITSIWQDEDNPDHLWGVSHNEEWAAIGNGRGFTASISLVEKVDGVWQDRGPILLGNNPKAPNLKEDVSGVGQPCAIVKDNEVFTYYIDWTKQVRQIYLAKAPKNADGSLGKLTHYYGNGEFNENYNPERLVSVLPVPDEENASYSALPDISYNNYLNQYIALFSSNIGVFQATSKDLLNWSKAKMVLPFDHPKESDENNWISYFTLLSKNQNTDQITNKTGILFYARRQGGGSHYPVYRTFEIK